jgi:hypothetical protein
MTGGEWNRGGVVGRVNRGLAGGVPLPAARVAELADALDLGSSGRKPVGVRVPPFALNS